MHTQDFLHHQVPADSTVTPPVAEPPRKRRKWKGKIAVVILLMIAVLGGVFLVAASKIGHGIALTKSAGAAAETALREGEFADAADALAQAADGVDSARSGIRLLAFLRIVPWVGTQLQGVSYTLDAGAETLAALREAVGIVAEVVEVTEEAQELVGVTDNGHVPYGELPTSARVALLEAIHDARGDLLEMQVKLTLARENLARLQTLNVSPALIKAVEPFAKVVDPLADAVDLMAPFAAAIPELAGLGEDRQFLLLFANDTELRPGGGFLGVYGLAVTRDGEIVSMTTEDTYNVDVYAADDGYQVTPPAPLQKYLGSTKWYFRDGNWSPDFPTTVKDTVQLMRQEMAYGQQPVPEVHGVLMFTPTFIGRLLDLLGPVTVDGQTFTSANIADKLEYEVEVGYVEDAIPLHQRKDIVARVTDTVVDRLLAMPSSQWPELFAVLTNGFAEKEMALWSADAETEATYVDAGWAGEIDPGKTDDVLMVVDANLAALKTDPEVDRTIAYSVKPSGSGYEATVAITYDHRGGFSWKTTRYRTYTRIYAPLGSSLVSSSGALANDKLLNPALAPGEVTVADELGMTSFGAFTAVEPGHTQTLSFTYRLPDSVAEAINDDLYELHVIKQLGAADHDLQLDLDFGDDVTFAEPAEKSGNWGDNRYTLEEVLDTDKEFTVRID